MIARAGSLTCLRFFIGQSTFPFHLKVAFEVDHSQTSVLYHPDAISQLQGSATSP